MRGCFLGVATVYWIGAAGYALADSDSWVGLYQGVDPKDGSTNYLSLSPNEDGTYFLHVSVTEHAKCGTAAVLTADAYIRNDKLVREYTQLKCAEGASTRHTDTMYDLDAENQIIVLTAPFDGRVIHYHRISQ